MISSEPQQSLPAHKSSSHIRRRAHLVRWLHKKGLSRRKLRRHWLFKMIGSRIFHSDLWRLRSDNIARGWLIGCMSGSTPFLGLQIIMAVPFNILFRAHLPTTILIILTTNPVTAPIYYTFAFLVGCKILDIPAKEFRDIETLIREGWQPLLVGCLSIGLVVGVLGYVIIRYFGHHLAQKMQRLLHHHS
ncbi:MAG: DUF2062 domain-containing protein [Methylacidiphilales bacterium]|nr:DUF2062 domain-containing protein [Candidatus Methylacidiphilales bacterium]MDW8348679.1 DUF2062 domain-containing protein [Verrucomicrobiae bacterium]